MLHDFTPHCPRAINLSLSQYAIDQVVQEKITVCIDRAFLRFQMSQKISSLASLIFQI